MVLPIGRFVKSLGVSRGNWKWLGVYNVVNMRGRGVICKVESDRDWWRACVRAWSTRRSDEATIVFSTENGRTRFLPSIRYRHWGRWKILDRIDFRIFFFFSLLLISDIVIFHLWSMVDYFIEEKCYNAKFTLRFESILSRLLHSTVPCKRTLYLNLQLTAKIIIFFFITVDNYNERRYGIVWCTIIQRRRGNNKIRVSWHSLSSNCYSNNSW